jgi:NRAMP (natural resistance-associated macrophage protein)-like metal ion transporter
MKSSNSGGSFPQNSKNEKHGHGGQCMDECCEILEESYGEIIRPFKFNFRKFLSYVGPGFLMSIAYLDPGNIAGDLEAGIAGGYSLIWTLMWATILGLFYQSMSARIGVVTQRNLAKLSAEQFTTRTRYTLWIMTEFAIIGSDIQEVIGSATALNILFGLPLWIGALITIFDSFLFLFIHYFGVRKLEGFFAILIIIMAVCFGINMIAADPDYEQMAIGTLLPIVPSGATTAALGLIGAVIMPHNLYLHSALVLTRKVDTRNKNQVNEANIYNTLESGVSLFISFVISVAIISTFAAYKATQDPDQDIDIDLNSASVVLASTFGEASKYIWAIGLLAAGQSSTMTGTYAGQFVMEGFLDFKLPIYQRVLVTRSIAIVPALLVSFVDPATLTGSLDTYLNILQSVQLPFALVPLIKFVGSEKIMGEFVLPKWQIYFASIFGVFLFSMNFVIIAGESDTSNWWLNISLGLMAIVYIYFIV